MSKLLQPGEIAPDFSYVDASGITCYAGKLAKPYLVYFYPMDNTPGCTAEACSLRDTWDDYLEAGVSVIGVSFDNNVSHLEFRKRHKLPFGLAADASKRIATAFGVYDEANFTHRLLPFARRVSFLVDKWQKIVKTYSIVNPNTHAREVLADIKKLLKNDPCPQPNL